MASSFYSNMNSTESLDTVISFQKEELRTINNNNDSTNRTHRKPFGTMGFVFVGNILQKLANILIPAETSNNTLAKTNQHILIPDVIVDKNICTPIFESTHGRTTLLIPEKNDTVQYQVSTSSCDNPYVWCSTQKQDNKIEKYGDVIMKKPAIKKKMSMSQGALRENCLNSQKIHDSVTFNKSFKNREERYCRDVLDIMDDFRIILDENGFDSRKGSSTSIDEKLSSNCTPSGSLSLMNPRLPDKRLHVDSFHNDGGSNDFNSSSSDCDSEDSFVIFRDDLQTTPSARSGANKDMCKAFNIFLKTTIPFERKQRRHLSECSDESIVFCYDSDYDGAYDQLDTDSESVENEEHECGKDSCDEMYDRLPEQPDSGFEEKKVRFSSNVDVHIMRTWNFAYRQARKGEWEMAARDRERFKKRIDEAAEILEPIFQPNVRKRIYCERFDS